MLLSLLLTSDFSMTLIRSHPQELPKFGTENSVWVSEQDHSVPHSVLQHCLISHLRCIKF